MRKISPRSIHFAIAAAALAIAAAGSSTAFAQGQMSPEMRAMAQACRADFNQLCPGVQPGGGRILACLQGQSSKLTPQCRDALAKAPKPGT